MLCRLLNISRQTYYNYLNHDSTVKQKQLKEIDNDVLRTFNASAGSFGTRMIRTVLLREGISYSREIIRKSMKRQNLVSSYNKTRKKKPGVNRDKINNILNRKYNKQIREVLTSDLTYVKVMNATYYVCFIVDICNSEIVGFEVMDNKTPRIVLNALQSIEFNLNEVKLFHTDRGTEFKNSQLDKVLETFDIQRSLSNPGTPADNAVSESLFKTFKTAWVKNKKYNSEYELKSAVTDFVKWYNNIRPHSKLEYKSPVEYRYSLQVS